MKPSKQHTLQESGMAQQPVRIIKTQLDHEAALVRLSQLMDEDIMAGSSKESELELLTLVIQSYERSKVAPVVPDAIEAVLLRMDQLGLKKKDMVQFFGSLPKTSEVLARKRALSLSMIRKLHHGLGIPADVLLGNSGDDDLDLTQAPCYDYERFPWQDMISRGYFPGFAGTVRQAKERAEELIRAFVRGLQIGTAQPARLRAPLHQSSARNMDPYALHVWTIAVLKKARKAPLVKTYVEGSITSEWLHDLAKLSRFEQGPRLALEYLADAGIALVFEDHFDKTYLDGAAMLDGNRPVVALTLRHDRLDNFWFALLHELVHVQKHLNPKHNFIPDNLDDKLHAQSAEEQQADEGARDALIPRAEWMASAVSQNPSLDNANTLANKLRVHPIIVAGRVRFEANNWRLLSGVKATVRQHFADQLGAKTPPA
jgi:HTH-type transcriptional regulator / antitoxin HigA